MGPQPGRDRRVWRQGHHPVRWPGIDRAAGCPGRARKVFDSGLPIFGICYGMQTLAAQLGGATEAATSASSATPK